MIVVMKLTATSSQVDAVTARAQELGLRTRVSRGEERTIVGLVGSAARLDSDQLRCIDGVERVVPIGRPWKLASRELQPHDTEVRVNDVVIGGREVVAIAGPCAVESRTQTFRIARHLRDMGVGMLRGGAFKPRTSPYSFQGLGEEGLRILADVREELGMSIVTEVMTSEEVPLVARYADMLQVGTRNMQNYRLLEALGRQERPVLLKRGMSATVEELLLAAEYVLAGGNPNVVLCERGVRGFDTATRATFDLTAVPLLKQLTHLPVIVDPSHATGLAGLVTPVSLGAIAAGADGLLVEAHDSPADAALDGAQSLDMPQVAALLAQAGAVGAAVGRTLDAFERRARRHGTAADVVSPASVALGAAR